MRFRTPPPTRYSNGRDQRKVLQMVGLLVLVLILANVAANPANWAWLTGRPPEPKKPKAEQAQVRPPERRAPPKDEEDDALRPDAVRILPHEEPAPQSEKVKPVRREVPGDDLALPPELLATVRDDVVGIPNSETDAFYITLAKAQATPEDVLEQHALRDLTYTQLFSEPDLYRGKLVTIEGDVRRLVKQDSGANGEGIDSFYQGWLFNNDSGDRPFVFYCLELPPELHEIGPGQKNFEHVRVTGYFFKRYEYASAGGLNSAPMLLAHTVHWIPIKSTAAKPIAPSRIPYILGSLALVGIMLGAAIWWFIDWGARTRAARLKAMKQVPEEAVAALANVEAIDPREELQRLADADKKADGTPVDQ